MECLILINDARVREDVANLLQLRVALHTSRLHLLLRLRNLVRDLLHLLRFLRRVLASLSLLANLFRHFL